MMATFDDDQYRLGLEDLTGCLGPFVVAVGHGGHRDGYKSVPAVIPDRQKVIVVFINKTDAVVERVANDLDDGDGAARVGDQVDHRSAADGDARLVTDGGLPGRRWTRRPAPTCRVRRHWCLIRHAAGSRRGVVGPITERW